MTFDPAFNWHDILILLGYAGSVLWIWIGQRDSIQKVHNRADLLEQKHMFLEQQLEDDRARSDRHWGEVRELLKDISNKLDRKADKE